MSSKIWGAIALAGLVVFGLGTGEAFGYEQTMTCDESGPYACDPGQTPMAVHWNTRCVDYEMSQKGSQNIIDESKGSVELEDLRDEVRRSFAAWTAVDCSDMTLVDGGLSDVQKSSTESVENSDDTNLVIWRDDSWSDVASANAFALTSVTFNPESGVIVDADIEFNTEMYDYSITDEPPSNHVDLRNTMTHEAGHFIGLDHTDVTEATMFATAPLGETDKRNLHHDDIEGICRTYPSTNASHADCDGFYGFPEDGQDDYDSERGCASGGGGLPGSASLILVTLMGSILASRKRRRSGA
ncbi:MAG: matrixin family metalloprotease [Persicimonas sp.]